MKNRIKSVIAAFGLLVFAIPAAGQVSYTPYEDAKPILGAMAEIIPGELRNATPETQAQAWNIWVSKRDKEIRARLAQGDADSIVNFLMFGTSFTTAPRLTSAQLHLAGARQGESREGNGSEAWQRFFKKRVRDLVEGMATPRANERLQFARRTLEQAGISIVDESGKEKARMFLIENVRRVLKEQSSYQEALKAAKSLNDPTEEFAERSKLYKERGLSLDTSLPPDYALEVALKEMKTRGLLKPGSVVRVGIIGPGLDFTDKQEGFDFYPTQTVQPFAVMDSLLRLGLAKSNEIEVDTLDLSPRILAHVERAARLGAKGRGYTIQLPRDPARGWTPELVAYWSRFGDQIGMPVTPVAVPASLKTIALRAVRVKPDFVRRMKTYDVNVVLQRAAQTEATKLDLLIATNILVYYDTFEQSLAMTNVAAMLKPGGYLLTNNLLLELRGSNMRSEGHVAVKYSAKQQDGDTIVKYRRVRQPSKQAGKLKVRSSLPIAFK